MSKEELKQLVVTTSGDENLKKMVISYIEKSYNEGYSEGYSKGFQAANDVIVKTQEMLYSHLDGSPYVLEETQ